MVVAFLQTGVGCLSEQMFVYFYICLCDKYAIWEFMNFRKHLDHTRPLIQPLAAGTLYFRLPRRQTLNPQRRLDHLADRCDQRRLIFAIGDRQSEGSCAVQHSYKV